MGCHVGFAGDVTPDIAQHELNRAANGAFARQPWPNMLPPELMLSSSAIGPLTIISGVVVLVAVWML